MYQCYVRREIFLDNRSISYLLPSKVGADLLSDRKKIEIKFARKSLYRLSVFVFGMTMVGSLKTGFPD